MGVISTAYDWFKSLVAPRKPRRVGHRLFSAGLYGASGTGYGLGWHNGDRREQVAHYRHWTFVAVRAIMDRAAALEPVVAHAAGHAPAGPGRKRQLVGVRKTMESQATDEQLVPAGPDHPLCQLFRNPNAWDVPSDLWSELVLFLELTGVAYLWCPPTEYGLRSGLMTPAELWVVPSHWVFPRFGQSGVEEYHVVPVPGGQYFHLPAAEVICLRFKSPRHKIDGWSPQQAGSEWIDAAESVDVSRFHQFKNGAFPLGAVELGEQYVDPSDDEMDRIYAKFFARLQGEHNYGKPIITPPGAKYTPLQINPAEMAYVESADQLRDWILALYKVPKEIAGIQPAGNELSWYAPLLQFNENVLKPRLRYLGQALTRFLASRYSDDLRVYWPDPNEDSPESLNAKLALMAEHGQVTDAEFRAALGYAPMSPDELARYSKLGQAAKPPAAAPPPPFQRSKSFREEDHPRADDGKFGSGGGADDGPDGDDDAVEAARQEAEERAEAEEREAGYRLLDAEIAWEEEDREVDRAREAEDARREGERDAEDAADEAVDALREGHDEATAAARDREDADVAAARKAEDDATDAAREAEDESRRAEEREREAAYNARTQAIARERAEQQALREAWDADLARRRAEPGADQDALDDEAAKEDEARTDWDLASYEEEERLDARREAWYERWEAQGDRLDARREREDAARDKAREREDAQREGAREREDAKLAKAREREDAQRERDRARREQARKAEDAEVATRRAREDGQREAARAAQRELLRQGKADKHLRRRRVKSAGWREEDHPRADDGKFGSGGGGKSGGDGSTGSGSGRKST